LSPERGRPSRSTQLVRHTCSGNLSGIAPKQNAFKFKIAPHKQKSIVNKFGRKMGSPGQRGPVLMHT